MNQRVFVTGLGVVTPIGLTVKDYWSALISGKSGISRATKFDTSSSTVKIAGEVKNFSPEPLLSPKEARRTDPFAQFALVSAHQAIQDANLVLNNGPASLSPERIGVIVGSGIGGITTWEREFIKLQESPKKVSPFFIPMMIMNSVSGEIAIKFGAKGPNYGTVSACATGAHAICDAYRLLKDGLADVMIAGGSESSLTLLSVTGFANMKALSTRNDEPEKASRPFDRDRDGFVVGEGAGVVILETEAQMRKRGAKPYCEIVGCGTTCDAYHITAPEPSGTGAAMAMNLALEEGKLNPKDVNYINAHGTSTPLNDLVETRAIKQSFGEYAKHVAISSIKSMTGHLLGAGGAIELIATALTIRNSVIPPTINLENPDPECDLDYVPNQARETEVNVAISNSFGFGGHNAVIALKKV